MRLPRLSPTAALLTVVAVLAASDHASAQSGLPGLLRDIAVSPTPLAMPLLAAPIVYVPLGGEVYFAAWDMTEGLELRASDGTAGGTRTVRDACPGSCHGFWGYEMVESGGVLYFTGDDGVHGRELWRSDGTRAGTRMVADGDHGDARRRAARPRRRSRVLPAIPGRLRPAPARRRQGLLHR